jgi:hypothetical protein
MHHQQLTKEETLPPLSCTDAIYYEPIALVLTNRRIASQQSTNHIFQRIDVAVSYFCHFSVFHTWEFPSGVKYACHYVTGTIGSPVLPRLKMVCLAS